MKIIKNVRSSEQQEQVTVYPSETHVLLGERVVEVDNQDGTTSTQYEYDKVIVRNSSYADVVESAGLFYNELKKQELLDSITVRTTSGKLFYADPTSRADLADAIAIGEANAQTSTTWKLAEPINGSNIATVTIDELKEARKLGLEAKGSIIGV